MKRAARAVATRAVPSKKRATTPTNNSNSTTNSSKKASSASATDLKNKLSREFYNKDSLQLCQDLLGKVLVRKLPHGEILRGVIVETEAYPGSTDRASSSHKAKITEKNRAMWMDPGTAYVYFTYGMYHCWNISSKGDGSACLIRAIQPLEDYETMHNFRLKARKKKPEPVIPAPTKRGRGKKVTEVVPEPVPEKKPFKIHELANGPGKLCMAFDIRRDNCDKLDMTTSDEMWLECSQDSKYNQKDSFVIETAKRVGIDSAPPEARDKLWRFFIENHFAVSTAKPSAIIKMLKAKSECDQNDD